MTRSRKQKSAARTLAASEGTSYVKSLYTDKLPFSGPFAKVMEHADKHAYSDLDTLPDGVPDTGYYCVGLCNCKDQLLPTRKRFWEKIFDFLPETMIPELAGLEFLTSKYSDWKQTKQYEDGLAYSPAIFATFYYPKGMWYGDYIVLKDRVSDAFTDYRVTLVPVGYILGYEEQNGSIGIEGFRVALMANENADIFSTYEWHHNFGARELFDADLWGIRHSIYHDSQMLTEKTSAGKISKVTFTADDSMTFEDMQRIADTLRGKTGVPWVAVTEYPAVHVSNVPVSKSRRVYAAYLSNSESTRFTDEGFAFVAPKMIVSNNLRFATSGEQKDSNLLPSAFSGDFVPVGFSDCIVERNSDGIIRSYKQS